MGNGFSRSDISRNACMLTGKFRKQGYDWWWHSLTARHRVTGEEKPFFIEYFVCNPGLAEDEPVLGQLPENKEAGKKPSYLMVKAGCWGEDPRQLHRFFAWKDVDIHMEAPYSVSAADCYASETRIAGSVNITEEEAEQHPEWMCGSGSMSWDLQVEKIIPFNVGYGAGSLFRALKAFEMYWHAEGMKTKYSGEIILNGVAYDVIPDKSYGYADKNWGCDFTSPWIWLSSNYLVSNITGKVLENSVFDIGGGRPKVFGIGLDRILLGAFYYEGQLIEFNFSKIWTGAKTKFDCKETEHDIVWHIEQQNHRYIMKTDIICPKKEMLLVNYEAPNGKKEHNCLWNGGNGVGRIQLFKKKRGENELIDDIRVSHAGCEYGLMDWDKEPEKVEVTAE